MSVCNVLTLCPLVNLPVTVYILTETRCLDPMSTKNYMAISCENFCSVVFLNLMLKDQFFLCKSPDTLLPNWRSWIPW